MAVYIKQERLEREREREREKWKIASAEREIMPSTW